MLIAKRFTLGKKLPTAFLFFLAFLLVSREGRGRDIFVPEDFPTIQEAIDASEFGDSVRVRPGIYYERVVIKAGISLISDSGPEGERLVKGPGEKQVLQRALQTIIDGSKLDPPDYLVSFQKESTAPMKLDGFTIRNLPTKAIDKLYLVEVRGCSAAVIINNIICQNHSKGKGGGLLLTGLGPSMGPPLETVAKPTVQHNVIYDNFGTGIANGPNSMALIQDNEIFNNHFPQAKDKEQDAPGIGIREYARPRILHNLCYQNGSGIGGLDLVSHDQPIVIQGNILRHNWRAGISLTAINNQQKHIVASIEENEVYGNLKAGIRLENISEATIRGNQVNHNLRAGIAVHGGGVIRIIQNSILGNISAGLVIEAQKALIEQNRIGYNLDAGIMLLPQSQGGQGIANAD
ncbi:MAG: right-handed parallel beta-helix repeat-containing protein [bacterium]|nr:right-handed parallel beta-helix repeat-containing protein [bacterium]